MWKLASHVDLTSDKPKYVKTAIIWSNLGFVSCLCVWSSATTVFQTMLSSIFQPYPRRDTKYSTLSQTTQHEIEAPRFTATNAHRTLDRALYGRSFLLNVYSRRGGGLSARKPSAFHHVVVSILDWLRQYWVALCERAQQWQLPHLWIRHLLITAFFDQEMKIASVPLLAFFFCSSFSSSQGKVLKFMLNECTDIRCRYRKPPVLFPVEANGLAMQDHKE